MTELILFHHAQGLTDGVRALADELRAEGLRDAVVYAGISLGVLPAQTLAQTRPGARGALLLHGCVPPSELGGPWPASVPVQIHIMEADEVAAEDLRAARELEATVASAELFVYPGDRHLFTDVSLAEYEEGAATVLMERVRAFLADLG
jgi:dienelactone hydrolase